MGEKGERDRLRWSDLRPGLRQALRPLVGNNVETLDAAVAGVETRLQGMVEQLADEMVAGQRAELGQAGAVLDAERQALESRLRAEFEAQVQALRDQANVGRAVRVLLGELALALTWGPQSQPGEQAQEAGDNASGL